MAKIIFSRKEFEKRIKLSKDVEEKISLFGTHLESINENEIELEILPNRPDLFSFEGFMRSFSAFLGKNTGLRKYKVNSPDKNFKVKIEPSVKNVRPFTVCAIVKNLHFDDTKIKEMIDLQEKLHTTIGRNRKKIAIGIYPLEKIKLPIRYLAENPEKIKFIPLEADREMSGIQILQKHPTGKEYAYLLEKYDKFPVFIDANDKILSMPPIINSHETGKVTNQTKEVFVECSGWHFDTLKKVLNIIVTTLADMGGKIYSMELNYDKEKLVSPDLSPIKMKISVENINKLLGLELKDQDLKKLLPRMSFDYTKNKVSIPAWRTDILHEVDIAEDVAIAYGYDKLIPVLPNIFTVGEESKKEKFKRKIAEIIIGLGLLELSSYHLIKKEEAKLMKVACLEVLDSKSEYKMLRPNLLVPTLRILSENKDNEYPQRTFELGKVFSLDKEGKSETKVKESEKLIIASCPDNFTGIKQILNYLMSSLEISYKLKEVIHPNLIEGRAGEITINDKVIGYIGEVNPETLKNWGIKMPFGVLEISLEEIFKFD